MKTQRSDFDTFFKHALIAALWSSTDCGEAMKRAAKEKGYSVEKAEITGSTSPFVNPHPKPYFVKLNGESLVLKLGLFEFDEGEGQAWEAAYHDFETGTPDGCLDGLWEIEDITPDCLEELRAHALSFWLRMWYYIDHEEPLRADWNASDGGRVELAGHDFWLTSAGHGSGFWDGEWPKYGEMLTKLSKCYPIEHIEIEFN